MRILENEGYRDWFPPPGRSAILRHPGFSKLILENIFSVEHEHEFREEIALGWPLLERICVQIFTGLSSLQVLQGAHLRTA